MSLYAAETKVPIEKTRIEIEATVRRYGADGFVSGWEGERAFVSFRCAGRYVKLGLTLPDRADARFTTYRQGASTLRRSETAAAKVWDQACRQKWRVLLLMIKGKLEAVESGIVTFEEEFLAHVLMASGRTLYEQVKAPLALSYDKGEVKPYLGGPS